MDARYQKFGFAWRAIQLLFNYVRTRPGGKEIFVSCVPGEGSLQGFYDKLGFKLACEIEDDEIVMSQDLQTNPWLKDIFFNLF